MLLSDRITSSNGSSQIISSKKNELFFINLKVINYVFIKYVIQGKYIKQNFVLYKLIVVWLVLL